VIYIFFNIICCVLDGNKYHCILQHNGMAPIKSLWSVWRTYTASFMTDGCEPPVTEG